MISRNFELWLSSNQRGPPPPPPQQTTAARSVKDRAEEAERRLREDARVVEALGSGGGQSAASSAPLPPPPFPAPLPLADSPCACSGPRSPRPVPARASRRAPRGSPLLAPARSLHARRHARDRRVRCGTEGRHGATRTLGDHGHTAGDPPCEDDLVGRGGGGGRGHRAPRPPAHLSAPPRLRRGRTNVGCNAAHGGVLEGRV